MNEEKKLLLIDIGNTNAHIGYCVGGKLVKFCQIAIQKDLSENLSILLERLVIDGVANMKALISHVNRPAYDQVINVLDGLGIRTSAISPILIKAYSQKNEMDFPNYTFIGSDLFCDAVGAYEKGKPCLIVDAGTCLKVLGINAKGEFLGGSIVPGRGLMLSSLNSGTDFMNVSEVFFPSNTLMLSNEGAVSSGLSIGVGSLVKGLIEQAKIDHRLIGCNVVLTGGDCSFLAESLKKIGYLDFSTDKLLTIKGLAKAFGEEVDFD